MTNSSKRPALGGIVYLVLTLVLGAYFTFAAVQGDYGLFRRAQIAADAEVLTADKARLEVELAELQNLTHRLSDGYLDIDLLDQQARDVLGLVRADEIVIR